MRIVGVWNFTRPFSCCRVVRLSPPYSMKYPCFAATS